MALDEAYGSGGSGGGSGTPDPTGNAAQLNSATPPATPSNWSAQTLRNFIVNQNVALDGDDFQEEFAPLTASNWPTAAEGGGQIEAGMWWVYTGTGVGIVNIGLGPNQLQAGDVFYARGQNPGQDPANWGTQDGSAGAPFIRNWNTGGPWTDNTATTGKWSITIPAAGHFQGSSPNVRIERAEGGFQAGPFTPLPNAYQLLDDGTVFIESLAPFNIRVIIQR